MTETQVPSAARDAVVDPGLAGQGDLTVTRLSGWERRTEWPLVAAAVIFLVAYAAPILDYGTSRGVRMMCEIILYATWTAFIVDYLTRLGLADKRGRYFRRHLPDLLVLAVPILRPLRLLVLLKMLNRRGAKSLRGRVAVYVASAGATVIFCAALAVLDADRHRAGANITNFGDALWWAVTTAGNSGKDTVSRKTYDLVAAGFGPGAHGPLLIVISLAVSSPAPWSRRSAAGRTPRRPHYSAG